MTESQFEKLFKENFPLLCNVAYSVVKDQDQARDIAQQVFIKFWDRRDKVDIEDNIKSYLKRAAVNTAINHLEKVKKLKLEDDMHNHQIFDDSDEISKEKHIKEVNIAVKKAVEELPNKCQTVFSLSRFDGMTNQEIADYLNVSVKAVEKHISKALKELRIKLKPYVNLISIIWIIQVGFLVGSLL